MTLFNSKRNRMVSVRLSDEEFQKLRAVCLSSGARSVSDLAREAMHRLIEHAEAPSHGVHAKLDELDTRLSRLQDQVRTLAANVGGGK